MSKFFYVFYIITLTVFNSLNLLCSPIDSLHLQLNKNIALDTNRANVLNSIANFFEDKANDSCLYYGENALSLSKKLNYNKGCGMAYNTIGSYFNGKGEYQKALENYINGYKIYEKINNRRAMSNLQNSIGNTYMGINKTDKALVAYTKSYDIAAKDTLNYMMGISSIGLGNIHLLKKNTNKALIFFTRAKNIFLITPKSIYALSVSYTLIGNALVEMNKYSEAFLNFDKAVVHLKNLNNTYGIAATYNVMGEAYQKKNDIDKALDYFLMSFKIFNERKAYDDLKNVSLSISTIYKQKNDYKNALEYYSFYNNFKDSVFNSLNNKQLLEVETKYETDKKNQEIEVQKLKLKEQIFQRNILIISIIVAILILILLYNRYNVKRKAHGALAIANSNLELKNGIIEIKNIEITDSIKYAQRIQNALLPSNDLLNKWLPQSFILFQPKDIVSGDFYWATEHNNKFYLAVCDCTGHGVPGAFMSLLNIGFLSEAIKEKNMITPSEIFNYVRERLINTISKDGQQDGMDGVILCYDKTTKEITYCASNNEPILIFQNKIIELPKDKMPVGKGENNETFTTHIIKANKGDMLYLYTDGYADQFGGPKGKKFKYKALNELLLSLKDKEIENQMEILKTTIENWKGNLEQVDDILIVGIKI